MLGICITEHYPIVFLCILNDFSWSIFLVSLGNFFFDKLPVSSPSRLELFSFLRPAK